MNSGLENISLVSIQRRGVLYLLTFSNDFEIRATSGLVKRLNLAEGAEFTQAAFDELKNILEEKFAWYTAESILARRPYSIGEFKLRLRRKDISESYIKRIVSEFREKKYLDDHNYSVLRIKLLVERKPAGRGYLVAWLQKRLVPREIAENAVAEVLEGTDEIDTAVELLKRKLGSFEKFDLETTRRKAYTYLSRRAISYGSAREAFDRVFGKTTD